MTSSLRYLSRDHALRVGLPPRCFHPIPTFYKFRRLPLASTVFFDQNHRDSENSSKREADRKANLGDMIALVKLKVPAFVSDTFPEDVILPNMVFRILPSRHSQLSALIPKLDTRKKYFTAVSAIQAIATSTVLSPNSRLHILSLRVSSDPDYLCLSPDANKIIVRWTTCPDSCYHLPRDDDAGTGASTDGDVGHDPTGPDAGHDHHGRKFLDFSRLSTSSLTKGFMGFAKNDDSASRVLLGIFIFELNHDNNIITAHTIEDVELIERKEPESVGKLRVC